MQHFRIVPSLVLLCVLVGQTTAAALSRSLGGADLPVVSADVDDWEVEKAFDVDDPEVGFIANKYGTSWERALSIANWQSEVDDLVEALPLEFIGNFAYAHLHIGGHNDDELPNGHIMLDLAFKNPDASDVVKAVETITVTGARVATHQSIAVRQVPKSLAELDAERLALIAQVGEDARIEVEYDIDTGTLRITPSEPQVVWPNVDCPTVTGGSLTVAGPSISMIPTMRTA